jgi:hypothetical protein
LPGKRLARQRAGMIPTAVMAAMLADG